MTIPSAIDPGFTTSEMSQLWSVASRVQAILAFEAALALSLADSGIAPRGEAEAVATACSQPLADPTAVWASTWERGTPLLDLTEEIRRRLVSDEQRQWVHYGATTQDAIDTAHMILAARSLQSLERASGAIARRLFDLVQTHRHQQQMARTFLQHARPTTFGVEVAGWLQPMLDHIESLRAVGSRLPAQLGGPVGDRAEFSSAARDVVEALAGRLGLRSTPLPWHGDRTPIRELVGSIDRAVASAAKIAADIALLASSDIGELGTRPGGSSSMDGKENPLDAMRALAAAKACHGAVSTIEEAGPGELDRGLGSWHVEWFSLPIVFQTAGAVFESVERLLEGLVVHGDVMAAHAGEDPPNCASIEQLIDDVGARFREVVAD